MAVAGASAPAHRNRHKKATRAVCESLVDVSSLMSLRVNACTQKQVHGLSRPAGTSAEVGQPIGSGAGHAPRRDPGRQVEHVFLSGNALGGGKSHKPFLQRF